MQTIPANQLLAGLTLAEPVMEPMLKLPPALAFCCFES